EESGETHTHWCCLPRGHFTSSKEIGVPTNSIRTMRRGVSRVTCIKTGPWPPDTTTRYATNVPAGTFTVSTPDTLNCITAVRPTSAENTLRLTGAVAASARAGTITCIARSSYVPAATVVSRSTVSGDALCCGDTT